MMMLVQLSYLNHIQTWRSWKFGTTVVPSSLPTILIHYAASIIIHSVQKVGGITQTGIASLSSSSRIRFNASSTTVAYPNLKELIINGQKHWEEWVMETSSEDINLMPLLQRLDIYECPELIFDGDAGSLSRSLPFS
ncbi:hypothetical protein GIB67_007977, partial [Kingdonia uniflora]